MGTTQPTTKGNNTNISSRGGGHHRRLFSFGACFGLSSPKKQHRKNLYHGPVRSAAVAHDHGDAVESLKYGSKKPKFAKSDIPTSESIKEIQIVAVTAAAAAEAPPRFVHQSNNKTRVDQDVTTEEEKNKQERSIPAEISSNPTMIELRHPASLPARPAPPQPRLGKGKTAAAPIGEGGSKDEMSAVAAGKFNSMVGRR